MDMREEDDKKAPASGVVDVEKLGSDTSIDKLPDDASDEIRLQKANELAERIAAGEGTEADYKVRVHPTRSYHPLTVFFRLRTHTTTTSPSRSFPPAMLTSSRLSPSACSSSALDSLLSGLSHSPSRRGAH